MKINIALSAVANFLALLNNDNPGKAFSATNVTLGTPTVAAGTAGRNTEIVITAVENQGYSGTETVSYTRQELAAGAAIATAKDIPVSVAPADTDAEILTKVATALGLLESELTISNVVDPENESTPGSADITADVDSLLYTGTYSVTLSVPDADVPLADAITTTDLSGFEPEA